MTDHARLGNEVVAVYRFLECERSDHAHCPAERDSHSRAGTVLCACECHLFAPERRRTIGDVRRLTGLTDEALHYLVRAQFIGEHGVLLAWDDVTVAQCLVYRQLYPDYDFATITNACRMLRDMPRDTWHGQSLVVGPRGVVHCVITHSSWWDDWTLISLDDIARALEGT